MWRAGKPADAARSAESAAGPFAGFEEPLLKAFDPALDGSEVANMVMDRVRAEMIRRVGFEDLLRPANLLEKEGVPVLRSSNC